MKIYCIEVNSQVGNGLTQTKHGRCCNLNPTETKSPQPNFSLGADLKCMAGPTLKKAFVFAFQIIKNVLLKSAAHSYHLQALENHFLVIFKSQVFVVNYIYDGTNHT